MIAGELEELMGPMVEDDFDHFVNLSRLKKRIGNAKTTLANKVLKPANLKHDNDIRGHGGIPPEVVKILEERKLPVNPIGLRMLTKEKPKPPKPPVVPKPVYQDIEPERTEQDQPQLGKPVEAVQPDKASLQQAKDEPVTEEPEATASKSTRIYWIAGAVLVLGAVVGIGAAVYLAKSKRAELKSPQS